MNYEKQAKDFCEKTGTKIDSRVLRYEKLFPNGKDDKRYIYGVTITRNGKEYHTEFGMGIVHAREVLQEAGQNTGEYAMMIANRHKPPEYDILAYMTKDEPEADVWDFAKECGYEINSKEKFREVQDIHESVMREYNGMQRMFSDVMEELRKIN